MRTFHVGGAASRAAVASQVESKSAGVVRFTASMRYVTSAKGEKSRYYLLAKYEMTQLQYRALMDETCPTPSNKQRLPIVSVSWLDALQAAEGVRNIEDAWLFFHMLFELIWQYRFLYRDLNDLLSKNRRLETHFQWVLKNKTRAVKALLDGMSRAGAIDIDSREVEATATSMVVVLTYWLSYEYVRDPRRALEPEHAQLALMRGAHHVLNLLMPYLELGQRQHLMTLVTAYDSSDS